MEKLTFEVVCLNGYRNFKGQNAYLKIKVWSILTQRHSIPVPVHFSSTI